MSKNISDSLFDLGSLPESLSTDITSRVEAIVNAVLRVRGTSLSVHRPSPEADDR